MTLTELMQGRAPDPTFEGFTTADDMVLAVNLNDATDVGGYLVAQTGVTEHSGALEGQSQDGQYIRTGKTTTKTGTNRVITLNGHRYVGDALQDAMMDHKLKYGIGQAVVKEYVFFNIGNIGITAGW